MAGNHSRTKGQAGERELARLLRDELGINATRNLVQSRDGGCDLLGVDGAAIEVKRAQSASRGMLSAWWQQAERQAHACFRLPVLAYRVDRQPWRFLVPLSAVYRDGGPWDGIDYTAELSLVAFAALVREGVIGATV